MPLRNESDKDRQESPTTSEQGDSDCLLELTSIYLPPAEILCEEWVKRYKVDQPKFMIQFLGKIHELLLQGLSPEQILKCLEIVEK